MSSATGGARVPLQRDGGGREIRRLEKAVAGLEVRLHRVERWLWVATGVMAATGGTAVLNLIRSLGGGP